MTQVRKPFSAFHLSLIILSLIALDQATKWAAIAYLKGQPPRSYLWDIFRFQYAENPGAFLSLGSSLSEETRFWILTVAVGGFLLATLVYLFRSRNLHRSAAFAFALLASGGVSNLIDRLFRPGGRVIDFMNMGIYQLRTGIFNIADFAILMGVFLLAIPTLNRTESSPQS